MVGGDGESAVGRRWMVVAAGVALLLFAAAVVRAAWLSDDAYITFRVVDNALAGRGLTWNPAERVQAYTHPLWLLALMAGRLVTGEEYYSAIWLSVGLSVVAVGLVAFQLRPGSAAAVVGVLVLALSRAFVDYSTSGLENPLTHLLLAAFLAVWFAGRPSDRRVFWLSLLAALLAVNRNDSLLLVAPALAWAIATAAIGRRRSWRVLGLAALGFLPLLLWMAFSLFYYGFPFPNTAYAKLATGIPAAELAQQGAAYLLNSLRWDPVTLAAIGLGLAVAVVSRRAAALAVAAGIGLYLVYIVRIGGDFMSGRFLAAPLLAAVAILIWSAGVSPALLKRDASSKRGGDAAGTVALRAALLLLLLLGVYGRITPTPLGDDARRDGDIADERAYYTPHTGLLYPDRAPHPWALQGMVLREGGAAVVEHGNVGFLGFYAGPEVHIVDRNGLTDPLLARLPVRDPANWRIGHFRREVPPGYVDTLREGRNVIHDADLAAFYEPLREATRGPLWSMGRLGAVWRLNWGVYDGLLPEVWPRNVAQSSLTE